MELSSGFTGRESAIVALFAESFTAAESAEEGARIGDLARALMGGTATEDLFVFTAEANGVPLGAILFSRLTYGGDSRSVFVLGPVAVATARQGEGIGQKLIAHGLARLRASGVDIAITYGDPAFYGKIGFEPIEQALVPAPFPLSHPEGWLGQSLTGSPIAPLRGPCRCVAAFDDPAFW